MSDNKVLTPTEILTAKGKKTPPIVVSFLTGEGFSWETPRGFLGKYAQDSCK